MQAVSNTGRSGVLVLKVDEDDVNTVLMNTDIENDGSLKYAYDNFADAFSENILEYAFAYADIPRNQITKKQREAAQSLLKLHEPEPEEDKEIETIFIEYSTLRVSAGTGEPLIDDTYPEFIEVKRSELTEEANFAVKINGNSMLPHYKNNDIVLVRSQPEVAVGEIGIFTIDGEGYIKERGENRLISLNPEYDDIHFKEGQDIRCKGLVIGTLEDEDFV